MTLRGPIALLKDSVSFYKTHFKPLLTLVLLPTALLAIGSYGMEIYTAGDAIPPNATSLAVLAFFVVLTTAAVILSIVSYIALVLFVAHPSQYSTAIAAYQEARKHFFPYLWVSVLVSLAVGGGLLLLIVPGIIFGVWFGFATLVVVLEQKRGMEALRESKRLVKGRLSAVFSRLLLLIVPGIVTMLAFSFFIGFFVPDETAATALSDGIGSIVVVPVMMIYLYFLYTDLKQNPPKVATVA